MVRDDLIVMIARATLQDGNTELRAFYSNAPETGWARVVDGTLEELTRVDDPTSEISSPSLIPTPAKPIERPLLFVEAARS